MLHILFEDGFKPHKPPEDESTIPESRRKKRKADKHRSAIKRAREAVRKGKGMALSEVQKRAIIAKGLQDEFECFRESVPPHPALPETPSPRLASSDPELRTQAGVLLTMEDPWVGQPSVSRSPLYQERQHSQLPHPPTASAVPPPAVPREQHRRATPKTAPTPNVTLEATTPEPTSNLPLVHAPDSPEPVLFVSHTTSPERMPSPMLGIESLILPASPVGDLLGIECQAPGADPSVDAGSSPEAVSRLPAVDSNMPDVEVLSHTADFAVDASSASAVPARLKFQSKSQPVASGVYDKPPSGNLVKLFPGDGVHISPHSKYGVWAGKYLTRLPFISTPGIDSCNALVLMGPYVEQLVMDAKDARQSLTVVFFSKTPGSTTKELGKKVRDVMARNKFAVVSNYGKPTAALLDAHSLEEYYQLNLSNNFQVHDALQREADYSKPTINMTLDRFLSNLQDPSNLQAILDCRRSQVNSPLLAKHVDESLTCFDNLSMLGLCPTNVSADLLLFRVWILIHGALFHTYPHHDAGGLGTWSFVNTGWKFWVDVSLPLLHKCKTREAIIKEMEKCLLTQEADGKPWFFPSTGTTEKHVIFAQPGDMIIQPPGVFHEVFTPAESITIGGHFLTFDTLHLTEASRRFDVLTKNDATNQDHEAVRMLLAAMILAIPGRSNKVYYKKALTALCRQILFADWYLVIRDHAAYVKGFRLYMRRHFKRYSPDILRDEDEDKAALRSTAAYKLEVFEAVSIHVADWLTCRLDLPSDESEFIMNPLPWDSPGEQIALGQPLLDELGTLIHSWRDSF